MKFLAAALILSLISFAKAESVCDLRVGETIGLKVVEFASGNTVYSKMNLSESTPNAISEEFVNLQDEGLCASKMISKKCTLKLEKSPSVSITLIRGSDRWQSWKVKEKTDAQEFVKGLKKLGFCS